MACTNLNWIKSRDMVPNKLVQVQKKYQHINWKIKKNEIAQATQIKGPIQGKLFNTLELPLTWMNWIQLGGSNSWFKMWCKIDVQLEIFNIKARDKQ